MMLKALTAVGLSCVVVASTFAAVEGPNTTKVTNAKEAKDATTTKTAEEDRTMVALPTAEETPKPSLLVDPEVIARLEMLRDSIPNLSRSPFVRPVITVLKTPTLDLHLPLNFRTGESAATGRIKFKFNDTVKARTDLVPNDRMMSLTGADLRGVEGIVAKYGGTVRQLLTMSPTKLKALEDKAFQNSNRRQTDLASMMLIEFPEENLQRLLAAAKELNEVDAIQWVRIEREILLDQEDIAGCGNVDNPDQCNVPSMIEGRMGPIGMGGTVFSCWNPMIDPGTGIFGVPGVGSVMRQCNPDPGCGMDTCIFGCVDGACCDQVAEFLPYCNDPDNVAGWDAYCAALANAICTGTKYDQINPAVPAENRYDPCLSNYVWNTPIKTLPPIAEGNEMMLQPNIVFDTVRGSVLGPCDEAHPFGGCNIPACCVKICLADPTCCTDTWDDLCVEMAATEEFVDDCGTTPVESMPTPNLVAQFNPTLNIQSGLQANMRADTAYNNLAPPLGPGTSGGATVNYPDGYVVHNWVWRTSPGDFDPANPPADAVDSSFLFSGCNGKGFDVPGMATLTGELWANYGGGAPVGRQTLPTPTKVWLYGAEFELVSANAGCRGVGGVQYDCADCLDLPGMTAMYPNFANGAMTANPNSGLNADFRLCPTGRKVGGAVIEFAAFVNHEEFVCQQQSANGTCIATYATPRVIAEEGQTMVLHPNNSPDHGTACLGVMVAGDNGFGVRGFGSQGQGYFFPTVSVEEGSRLDSALINALETLPTGSCINMSIGFGGGNVITSEQSVYTLVSLANDINLVIAISAGNDSVEITGEAGEDPSGAIIVGATWPGEPLPIGSPYMALTNNCQGWGRMPFSNWSRDNLVPVCAFGVAVASTGYGTVFEGQNSPTPDGQTYETNKLRTYCGQTQTTSLFNGTSAASPQVAGVAMWLQGFAQMFYGQFLTSTSIGGIIATGTPYCSTPLGTGPGSVLDPPTFGDEDPLEEANPIGIFPNTVAAALGVLTNLTADFDGSLEIYTGQHLQGNLFSLGTTPPNFDGDNSTLRIRSEFAPQGTGPANLPYLGSGPTIDFGVVFETAIPANEVDSATLRIISSAAAMVVVQVPFVLNQEINRYVAVGVDVLTATLDTYDHDLGEIGLASQYFTPDGEIDVRIYALGLGFLGTPSMTAAWDVVWPIVNEPVGGVDP